MVQIGKQVTCPFCFNTFTVTEIEFRCINSRCPGRAPDSVYAEYQGLPSPPMLGKIFSPERTNLQGLRQRFKPQLKSTCPDCQRDTPKRVCPICHYDLMHDAGLMNERIIAVIGGRSSGKSNFIAALVHTLENRVGANFNAGVRAMGDSTRTRYEEDFYGPLFRNHRVIPPTVAATVDARTKIPMVFRITFDGPGQRSAANLVLFDTAGEDMQSLDTLSTEARYICFADALIFLLDPLQIEAVRQQVGPTIPLPAADPGAEPIAIIERLRDLYERQFQLKATEKIKKPVAFTLAKIDTLLPIIDPGSGLHHTGEHFGAINVGDIESIHTEISAYLQTWMGSRMENLARTNFGNYRYFGVSSFGKMPAADNTIGAISPIRVEDPVLWILHDLGLIKSKK